MLGPAHPSRSCLESMKGSRPGQRALRSFTHMLSALTKISQLPSTLLIVPYILYLLINNAVFRLLSLLHNVNTQRCSLKFLMQLIFGIGSTFLLGLVVLPRSSYCNLKFPTFFTIRLFLPLCHYQLLKKKNILIFPLYIRVMVPQGSFILADPTSSTFHVSQTE